MKTVKDIKLEYAVESEEYQKAKKIREVALACCPGYFSIEDEGIAIDSEGDIWIYDPENKTGHNLCRDTGEGWVIVYENSGLNIR